MSDQRTIAQAAVDYGAEPPISRCHGCGEWTVRGRWCSDACQRLENGDLDDRFDYADDDGGEW